MIQDISKKEISFAGHDTFHLRYSWLPKAADYLKNNNNHISLSDYPKTMMELGVGKNMASSLRHWAESSTLFNKDNTGHTLSDLGKLLFELDPYLEAPDTNWLLHYLISTNHKKNGLWFYLFNVFNEQVIIKEEFIQSATNWFNDLGVKVNKNSIERDFQCLMNMYDSSKSKQKKPIESMFLSPFRELKLLAKVGDHYHLRSLSKPEISQPLFSFVLLDYLEKEDNQTSTPFIEILNGMKSPARVFQFTEIVLFDYLKNLNNHTKGFLFDTTAGMQQLIKNSNRKINHLKVLKRVYEK